MPTKRCAAFPRGLGLLLACALALTGCAAGAKKTRTPESDRPASREPGTDKAYVPGVDVTEASLRGGEFVQVPELETIFFDYDSSTLSEPSLATLKKNAAYLRSHDLEARVAGYCDERGTIEYNLALGQKRAKEVREYYIRLGVPGQAVATISYGKEQPLCAESSEECWSQNRRAETGVKSRSAPAAAEGGDAP